MKSTASVRRLQSSRGRTLCFLALAVGALWTSAACEDKAIGRQCDLTEEIDQDHGGYNSNATDCPSRLCVKPMVQPGVSTDLDTGPYCSAECDSDNDCDGQTRDPSNPNDKRCRKGFSCALVFPTGKLACKKICLCRDFFSASVGPAVPEGCDANAGASSP
ncbi:MAG: hypothetical protein JXP73_17595 [Deltaproteobacteria bacterium]|nr:hypothetical protein [Deltaproteobacteria bacterium]